jgi:phosphatidylserine/phosphatidylglycerophosphate/cardiolipin synthase-like enzyme
MGTGDFLLLTVANHVQTMNTGITIDRNNLTIALWRNGKWSWRIIALIFCASVILMFFGALAASVRTTNQFSVYYSLDKRQNDAELIKVIDGAQKFVYFAIYYFTKGSIADALIRAKSRGVDVIGIMDREASANSNARILESLESAGIAVVTQKHPEGIMHVKALVTEHAYASGSYNWTDGATNINDEVLEIGTNNSVRKKYLSIIKNLIIQNQ